MSNHSTRTQRPDRRRNATKIAASVALVGAAAAVAGLGTFGSFTSSTSATESVSNGTVKIGLGTPVRGLELAATNLVPGDTVQRAVTLTRSSDTEAFGTVALTTTAASSNALTTDKINGLKMTIEQCSTPWTVKAQTTTELVCATAPTVIVTRVPVITSSASLAAATTALNTSGAAANLRVTLELPVDADNTFQGLANTLSFTFDATQRAAQAR